MNLTIHEKKENPLLQRVELKGTIQFEGATPPRTVVTEALAKELKTPAEQITLESIHTRFGEHLARFTALSYSSVEARRKATVLTPHEKKKIKEIKEAAAKEAGAEKKEA